MFSSIEESENELENLDDDDLNKQIICISNLTLASEVINYVKENDNRFKRVLIFDLENSLDTCDYKE